MFEPKILLLDDEEIVYKTVRRCLRYFPCELVWRGNPLKVLQELDDLNPDLVILDLNMPGLSGIEFVSRIQTGTALRYPTLILTGHGELENSEQLLAAGVFAVMQKPFNFEIMVSTVEAALASVST